MGAECQKSMMRRVYTPGYTDRFLVGAAVDIGAGPDGLDRHAHLFPRLTSVRNWDLPDGDAQLMATVKDASYDVVHSSHCLEHMRDPYEALKHWWRILRPGGHLVVMIPDEDLYEQGVFPSTFNGDHKTTWTIAKGQSWSPKSVNVGDLLKSLPGDARVLKIELLDRTYRVTPIRFDQTGGPLAESAIEFIVRKEAA